MRLTPEAMRLMYFINQQHCIPASQAKALYFIFRYRIIWFKNQTSKHSIGYN